MPIEVQNLSSRYDEGTAFEKEALTDVSFTVEPGEFIGIIGHTGSGKSTLIQHLNALMTPSSGTVLYNGEDIFAESYKPRRKEIRQKVGLVFQYPEHQLFEMTIRKDVAFGPTNMQLPPEEVDKRVEWALSLVGMGPEFYEKSPFDLSGGQKRRVALAGVLAMQPEYLVLDEPCAGLDPAGRDDLFAILQDLQKQTDMAVLLVSHSMDDVAEYVRRILVMDHGHLRYDGTPSEVFSHTKELEEMGLDVPRVVQLSQLLRQKGIPVPEGIIRLSQMEEWLADRYHTAASDPVLRTNGNGSAAAQEGRE